MHTNANFFADQNSTSPKVQGLISRVRLPKMFPLFEVLFMATKRVCLQNIELKYQKLSLFWKARDRFLVVAPKPGGYSHIFIIRVWAALEGIVFKPFCQEQGIENMHFKSGTGYQNLSEFRIKDFAKSQIRNRCYFINAQWLMYKAYSQ